MRRLPRRIGYRIRFSPLDGLVFGLGFWIAWAIVTMVVDAVRGERGHTVVNAPAAAASQ